jgi:prolyl-tRNA editing enzyme YbaK/EbsC (Cys-tRNA(Pro) deacylase)
MFKQLSALCQVCGIDSVSCCVQVANEVGKLPKSKMNMRMVADEVTAELTGYGHNSVTPICSATRMPIVMSDKIAALDGPFFLGAGETDLKVSMPASAFLEGFKDAPVYVVNISS